MTILRSTASTSATVRPLSESNWVHVGGSRKERPAGEVVETRLRGHSRTAWSVSVFSPSARCPSGSAPTKKKVS